MRKCLAYHFIDLQNGKADVWIQDLASGSRTRLTVDPARSMVPVWSHDGTQVAYYSTRSGKPVIYVKSANGMGVEQKVWEPPLAAQASDWTPDSKALILQERSPTQGKWRLLLCSLDGNREPTPLLEVQGANVKAGLISPDGHWIAYESDESGKYEIYVSPFPKVVGKLQISLAGGAEPRWRQDGREIYYLASDGKLMSAELKDASGSLQATSVRTLFQTKASLLAVTTGLYSLDSYDVTGDGRKFLVNVVATEETAAPLSLVQNWTAELKNKRPDSR